MMELSGLLEIGILVPGLVQVFKIVLDEPLKELTRHFLFWFLSGLAGGLSVGVFYGWDIDYIVYGVLLGIAISGNINLLKSTAKGL